MGLICFVFIFKCGQIECGRWHILPQDKDGASLPDFWWYPPNPLAVVSKGQGLVHGFMWSIKQHVTNTYPLIRTCDMLDWGTKLTCYTKDNPNPERNPNLDHYPNPDPNPKILRHMTDAKFIYKTRRSERHPSQRKIHTGGRTRLHFLLVIC